MISYISGVVVPIVKGAAHSVINTEKMAIRIKDLERDNKEAREAIRDVYHNNGFSQEVIKKFLPEVYSAQLEKEREEAKAEANRLDLERKRAIQAEESEKIRVTKKAQNPEKESREKWKGRKM